MADKQVDWIAIEAEYRSGVRVLRVIADAYGTKESTIRTRAAKHGWIRDAAGAKREIVKAAMAGSAQDSAQTSAQEAMRGIEAAAGEDISDMERGIRISRSCLASLETASGSATEPKEIKVIVEAASLAIDSIRKIRGLDAPSGGGMLPPPEYKIVSE